MTKTEQRALERKRKKDLKTLEKYDKQLRNQRQEYKMYADAYALTGRKNRAAAVGECVIQLTEKLNELKRKKNLLDGTLFWIVEEQRVKDEDGRKGFRYIVAWNVKSDEPMYTDEEIRKEIGETAKLLGLETDEMFGITGEEETDEGTERAAEPAVPEIPEPDELP